VWWHVKTAKKSVGSLRRLLNWCLCGGGLKDSAITWFATWDQFGQETGEITCLGLRSRIGRGWWTTFHRHFFWHMPEWHHTRGSKPKWWASTLKQWTCWGFSFWPPGLLQNCPRVGRAPSKGYFGLDGGQWTLLEINTHTKLQFLNKAQSSH